VRSNVVKKLSFLRLHVVILKKSRLISEAVRGREESFFVANLLASMNSTYDWIVD
jgi:hypothetical protein